VEKLMGELTADKFTVRLSLIENTQEDVLLASRLLELLGVDNIFKIAKMEVSEHRYVTIGDLKISGDELKDLGFSGRDIGDILRYLAHEVALEHVENDKASLMGLTEKIKKKRREKT
jgi:tRNA nucleotidyltransferase (CCA-adding enzyme)